MAAADPFSILVKENMEMTLSDRLTAIVNMVPPCRQAADVGTDHGFVPITLVERGIAGRAIAMDVRPGPLARAKSHIAEHGLEQQIETRLSDGLAALNPGEADVVIIAGMGGGLMMRILEEGKPLWDSVDAFILSPQSDIDQVRRYLRENGLRTAEEDMIREDGKYYVVMKAACGAVREESYIFDKYGRGLIEKAHPVLLEYLGLEEEKLQDILKQLRQTPTAKSAAREETLRQELELIGQARSLMAQSQEGQKAR